MRSTRAVFLVCLLLVCAAVPLMAQESASSRPQLPSVSIPAGGAGVLDTPQWVIFYDASTHKARMVSKTMFQGEDDKPVSHEFSLR